MEIIVYLDQYLSFWVQNHLVTTALSPLMVGLSTLGNFGAVWLLLGLLLLCSPKYRTAGWAVLLSLGFSLVVGNGLLKHLVTRARPCLDYPGVQLLINAPAPNDYSFPSGHTFASFAAATAVTWSLGLKKGAVAFLLAFGIGFSRIYLFMHYPSDVLAGAVLGMCFGDLAWLLAYHWVGIKAYCLGRERDKLIVK